MTLLPVVRRFRFIGLFTLVIVYLLILVGGGVRASGSGMGCPDWPTCFGQWIPPTHESQLPDNYQQIYADRGYSETKFNARKTWIEYINRLFGVLTGFAIFLTVLFAVPFLKRDKTIFYYSLGAFILVGFEGWLGAKVVASNLMPGMITVHMLVAQVIVAMVLYALVRSQKNSMPSMEIPQLSSTFQSVLVVAMMMTLVQVILGTQVREAIDVMAHQFNYDLRNLWVENLPAIFMVHKGFSIALVVINVWLVWKVIFSTEKRLGIQKSALALLFLLITTAGLGLAMDQFNIPAVVQPFHMWFASLIFGVQYYLYIVLRNVSRD